MFLVHLKIEENSRMLRTGDLGIPINPSDRWVGRWLTITWVFIPLLILRNPPPPSHFSLPPEYSLHFIHFLPSEHPPPPPFSLVRFCPSPSSFTSTNSLRSPSPEPIYSHDGKRLNTREVRVRKKLEDERHDLVQKATVLNSDYKPPADYKYMWRGRG